MENSDLKIIKDIADYAKVPVLLRNKHWRNIREGRGITLPQKWEPALDSFI